MTDAARERNPLFSPAVILLTALSLSIGWGIRGNFGHESGAMIPGALAAIVIAACSRRADWQSRIPHAALLGGLGYGFGGSISYMYPISYTHSGHFDTMVYGFLTTFLEGGLWCALGVAGAALALTSPRDRLARIYPPLLFVLAGMFVLQLTLDPIAHFLTPPERAGWDSNTRQESPLYWFDADWIPSLVGLASVCVYDLWSRRFSRAWALILLVGAGALLGWLAQFTLDKTEQLKPLLDAIVIPQGDLNYVNPATGKPFPVDQLMTNWPRFFGDHPQHTGWLVGAFIGFLAYFAVWGKWKNDSGLFVAISLGWFLSFLAMPVFGSIFMMQYGGFRMTPPRSDDWAGIVGVFLGVLFWTWRRDQRLVTFALTLGFFFGGFGFTTAHLLRTLARIPGHPSLNSGPPSAFLQHYQSANWHSVMEQSQGFCLGLATVLALAFIWRRDPACTSGARMPGWTTVFAVLFTLFGFTFMNLYKLVETWIDKKKHPVMPEYMKAPLIEFIDIHALAWFNIAWWAAALAALALCLRNRRQPLAFLPASDAGRAQLLWFAVVWIMVLGNFSLALPAFTQARLITEWVIFINACIATALIGIPNVAPLAAFAARRSDATESESSAQAQGEAPEFGAPDISVGELRAGLRSGHFELSDEFLEEDEDIALSSPPRWAFLKLAAIWIVGLGIAIPAMYGYAKTVDYGYHGANVEPLTQAHRRFGPDAIWRTKPILKHGEHR